MAHEMYESDQMYSVREAPWHMGRGTNVTLLDTNPDTRPARIAAAGHGFRVLEGEVFRQATEYAGAQFLKVPGYKMLTRDDTGGILHITKDSYTIVQNSVGHELFEVMSEGADLGDGTGGTVKEGRVCYLSARVEAPAYVNGDDSPIFPYVVVSWTHDGSGALTARRTTVRPVCWNTISFGEAESRKAGTLYTFRHTKNVMSRVEEAKRIIAGAVSERNAFIELANDLAAITITDEQREVFVKTLRPAPDSHLVISDRVLDNINRDRNKLRSYFDSPTIPEAHRNTAYGLVQAGVEFLDHGRAFQNQDTYLGRTLLRDEPLKKALVPMVRKLVAA